VNDTNKKEHNARASVKRFRWAILRAAFFDSWRVCTYQHGGAVAPEPNASNKWVGYTRRLINRRSAESPGTVAPFRASLSLRAKVPFPATKTGGACRV